MAAFAREGSVFGTAPSNEASLLGAVPKTLPSLAKAAKLQKKAAKTGFDWDDVQDIWDKVNEELKEFSAEASY